MKKSLISPYRIVGNLVYTAGVTAAPGDTPTQIRNCFEKLKGTLKEAGTSLDKVVKANVYLTDLSDREKFLNDIWREYFPKNPPGRTTVEVGLGKDTKVEIEAVAEIGRARKRA